MVLIGRNNTTLLGFFIENPDSCFSKRELSIALRMNKNSVHWALVDLLVQRMVKEDVSERTHTFTLHPDLRKRLKF